MPELTHSFSELGRLIDQVSRERGIDRKIIIDSICQGLLSAMKRQIGTYKDIEVKFNEESSQFEVYEFKEVVPDDKLEDDQIEITLTEALKLDPGTQVNDQIGVLLEQAPLGRIDAYTARQIVVQGLKSAENEVIFNEFEKRKGEIASGLVRRVDPGTVVVELDRVEAYIPKKEQIYGEKYKAGEPIQGYILEVRQRGRGPQIIMSRAHPNYLLKLCEKEVPEIYEGIVKVVSVAREPGQRAKIAVYTTDQAVHPVGACVGMKGSRIQNITQELKGERIDVIVWEENPVTYVCNALTPTTVSKVLVDEGNKTMDVIVEEDQLALAIGKNGQNVKLVVKLTGWNVNITSTSEYEKKKQASLFNLLLMPGVNETMAESIFQCGFESFQELAESSIERILNIPGYDKESGLALIQKAKDLVQHYKEEGKEIPQAPVVETRKRESGADAKQQADIKLKQEIEQLEKKSGSSSGKEEPQEPPEQMEKENTAPEDLKAKKTNEKQIGTPLSKAEGKVKKGDVSVTPPGQDDSKDLKKEK